MSQEVDFNNRDSRESLMWILEKIKHDQFYELKGLMTYSIQILNNYWSSRRPLHCRWSFTYIQWRPSSVQEVFFGQRLRVYHKLSVNHNCFRQLRSAEFTFCTFIDAEDFLPRRHAHFHSGVSSFTRQFNYFKRALSLLSHCHRDQIILYWLVMFKLLLATVSLARGTVSACHRIMSNTASF